jgi:dTDP-4-dehydrorhamnose reductase
MRSQMNNSLHKILITGGNGQLAQAFEHHPLASEFELINLTANDLDITDITSIEDSFGHFNPEIIVNTAAYTMVDQAEQEKEKALLTNHQGAENLAFVCEQYQIPLIHFSTDYIFDGKKNNPYTEEDAANPLNHYGKSKWLGEQAIRQHCEQHIILRVSGVFSEYRNNFYNTMQRLAKNKTPLRVITDQILCPTYAGDIAEAVFTIIKKDSIWGTYNFCSSPPTSWHQFAEAILQQKIFPIKTIDYPTAAARPAYSVLDCHKIANIYGIKQPSWKEALEKIR